MGEEIFYSTTLENGLTLVFESVPQLSSTAVGFIVHTGSRDEPREICGLSHFLEHMCFKGTPRRTWEQISREVDGIGALWNAFTWWEGTAYYHWVQDDRVDVSIDILCDMMRSALAEPDFDTEKKVILEEIAMYNDNPSSLIVDLLIQNAFRDHPLGISVLGTQDTVSRIRHQDMMSYFRRRYTPDNMVFLATGAIDRERLVSAVRKHTGAWKTGDAGRDQARPEFFPGVHCIHRPEVTREHLAMAWPGPEIGSEWESVAAVLARYLGEAENSRLYWAVKQKGLVDRVHAAPYGFSDSGFMYVYASCSPEKAPEVLDIIKKEMALAHENLDEEALARSKTKAESALVRQAEHGLYRWMQLAERENAGAPRLTLAEAMEELEAVTPDRVREFLEAYALVGEPALVALGPLEELR